MSIIFPRCPEHSEIREINNLPLSNYFYRFNINDAREYYEKYCTRHVWQHKHTKEIIFYFYVGEGIVNKNNISINYRFIIKVRDGNALIARLSNRTTLISIDKNINSNEYYVRGKSKLQDMYKE